MSILWKLYQNRTMRYNELKRSLVGITNIMLTRSLQTLQEKGLVSRAEFNQIPPRVEYSLTENGLKLAPALESIYIWGHDKMLTEGME